MGSRRGSGVKIPYTSIEIQETQNSCSKQSIHSVNQLSIYGAVANSCQQFGLTEEEEERANLSVDKKMLTNIPLEEVQLLVSRPTMVPRNRMQENVLSFETLSGVIQLTQQCEKSKKQRKRKIEKQRKTKKHRKKGVKRRRKKEKRKKKKKKTSQNIFARLIRDKTFGMPSGPIKSMAL